jgi:cytochrome o ubiquinol oxidase operon protein cyoD
MDIQHQWKTSLIPLVFGFLLSIALTLTAYFIVVEHFFSGTLLLFLILGLGCVQALVQLVSFLHLGIESKPRWNLMIFLFMVLVIIVVIGGSLWIMYNLNYHMMPTMGM